MAGYSLSASSGNFTLDRPSLFFSPTDNKQEIYDTFVKTDIEQSPPSLPPQYFGNWNELSFLYSPEYSSSLISGSLGGDCLCARYDLPGGY